MSSLFYSINFYEISSLLKQNGSFEVLFPFLLVFAVLYSALSNIKFFKNENNILKKSVVLIISTIVSFYAVSYELSPGYSLGKLLSMMFPNISTITILVLTLYLVGAILGKNIFTDLFRRHNSTYLFFAIAVLGLSSVIFYLGIAFGFWDYDYLDHFSYWNVYLAVAFLIMGIVFLFIGLAPIGIIFLVVFFVFVYNYGQGSFLSYFIDPFVFIIFIVVVLFNWVVKDDVDKIKELEKSIKEFEDKYKTTSYIENKNDRIYDIEYETYMDNKKKLKKLLEKK